MIRVQQDTGYADVKHPHVEHGRNAHQLAIDYVPPYSSPPLFHTPSGCKQIAIMGQIFVCRLTQSVFRELQTGSPGEDIQVEEKSLTIEGL
jgi:hypothetical protein